MTLEKAVSRFRGPLIIFAVVILANFLFLTGIFKSNPIDSFSGQVTFTHVGIYGVYNTIDPNNAYSTQALGRAGVNQVLHGDMPWWNYNEQVGAPLAGGMQSGSLFLPFNFLLALSNGVLYFHIVLELVAGLATYYLLKRLKLSEIVAIVGGSLFALNGTHAWLTSPDFNPIAFLPLLILGIEIALDKTKKSKKGGWILIALAVTWSIYAGFPEAAYLDGLFAGIWFLVRAYELRRSDWLKFSLKVLAGLAVGVLLAAPVLVAFLDYLVFANVGGHAGALSHYTMPVRTLPAQVMPYIYGPIFQYLPYDRSGVIAQFWSNVGGYVTMSSLFLATVAVFKHKRQNRALIYMLGVFSLVIFARIYGVPGFTPLINLIPGMKLVAVYRYINPTVELAVVIMAMFGLEAMLSNKKTERPSSKTVVRVGLAMLAIVACLTPMAYGIVRHLYLAPHHRLWFALSVAWCLGSVAAIVFSFFYLKKYCKYLIPAILLIDALVMFIVPQPSSPRSTIIDHKPVTFLQENLGTGRFYSMGYIMPNYGSYFGIASINTNNEPTPKTWNAYIPKHLNSNVYPSQQFTGIDKLDPKGITPTQAFLKNIANYAEVSVKYVAVRNGVLPADVTQNYPLKEVYKDNYFTIFQLNNTKPYFETIDGNCKLDIRSRDTVEADCAEASTIKRRELYAPGWTAKANGKAVTVSKSGEIFQKVNLPKGRTTVKFNYTPPFIFFAYAAFAVGTGLIIYFVVDNKRTKIVK